MMHRVVSVLYLPESHSCGLSGYGGGYSTINGQAANQRDGQPKGGGAVVMRGAVEAAS